MKRGGTQSSTGSNGGGPKGAQPAATSVPQGKKAKFEGPSFEEELGMMNAEFIQEQIDVEESTKVEVQQKMKWMRTAPAGGWNCAEKPLLFHWLDIDLVSGPPLFNNPDGTGVVHGSQEGPVPIIRFYGVNGDGHSVLCNVHGVTPYFYVQLSGMTDLSEDMIWHMRTTLDQRVSNPPPPPLLAPCRCPPPLTPLTDARARPRGRERPLSLRAGRGEASARCAVDHGLSLQ